jgi:hypothetical protein
MPEPGGSAMSAAVETSTAVKATAVEAVEASMEIAAIMKAATVKMTIVIVVKNAKPEADPHG